MLKQHANDNFRRIDRVGMFVAAAKMLLNLVVVNGAPEGRGKNKEAAERCVQGQVLGTSQCIHSIGHSNSLRTYENNTTKHHQEKL